MLARILFVISTQINSRVIHIDSISHPAFPYGILALINPIFYVSLPVTIKAPIPKIYWDETAQKASFQNIINKKEVIPFGV